MNKKRIAILTTTLASAAAAALGIVSWNIANTSLGGRRQTYEEALNWQKEHYDVSFFDKLDKEEYTVNGFNDYVLRAVFCKNLAPTDRCVILTHGYSDNHYGSLKYMQMYLDLGFHCIIYDLRGHGENAPCDCTYGILESKDLLAVLEDARTRFPFINSFGLHGESLGSATTLTALGSKPDVAFAIADCGFADIENVLEGVCANVHLPAFTVKVASLFAKLRTGYAFSEMRPIDHLSENEIPILFIHGADDSFITPDNSERMSKATKGYSELKLIPGAQHANSILTEPEMYQSCVEIFLKHF